MIEPEFPVVYDSRNWFERQPRWFQGVLCVVGLFWYVPPMILVALKWMGCFND